jgi:hypothetical protein
MPINEAAIQPDLPIASSVIGRYTWDEFDPPIVIHLLADGRIMVNGDEVKRLQGSGGHQRCAEDDEACP